mmetsp:Transcript_34461/g.64909  ORF Transcript_34461/g.64909 Transcript_34461/m.64909 type:complete len:208 (-) Transcript_34461:183-806(-)
MTNSFSLALAAATTPLWLPADAAQAGVTMSTYTDEVDKYSISIPEEWDTGLGGAQGASGTRRVVAFFPTGKPDTNVTVVVTNVAADFTKLGSFGNAYEFGTRLVGSLDRRYMQRKSRFASDATPPAFTGQAATLLNTSERDGMYNVEYTLAKSDEFYRHLVQVVAIGNTGFYNRLYTVTGQAPEEDWASMESTLKEILSTFVPPQQN